MVDASDDGWRRVYVNAGMTISYNVGEADGAYPNGSRVIKVRDEPGDLYSLGAMGTVVGSMDATPELMTRGVLYLYWVKWDDRPEIPAVAVSYKLGRPQ